MRAYAMVAQVEGNASKEGLDTALLSLACCMRMWKVSVCAGRVWSEGMGVRESYRRGYGGHGSDLSG